MRLNHQHACYEKVNIEGSHGLICTIRGHRIH